MKKVISAVKANEADLYKSADTVNNENFPAWKLSEKEQLKQLALCGTLSNAFYASTQKLVDDALELIKKANPQDLSEAIILGRNEGFIRSFNILGLAYLSTKDPVLFKDAFSKVIITGNDLKDFIDTVHQVRGFGRSIKSAIHKWIGEKTNPFYSLKYRKEIADAIRISRFKGEDPIYAFILNIYNNVKSLKDEKIKEAYEKYPQLKAYEDMKIAVDAGDYKLAVELVNKHKLEPTSLISEYDKFTGKVWDAVAAQMGVMLFLKYLNKLTREDVFKRTGSKLLKEKLTVENLKKAKVFPFRLFIAYQNVEDVDVKNHLADVLDDYVTKYDWNIYNKQSWAICPDISGSMTSAVQGSDLTPAIVAGMFSGFFYKGLTDSKLLPWSTEVHLDKVKPKRDSIISHIASISDADGGGTAMESPLKYMIDEKLKVDNAVFITDSMEWGEGWLRYWKEYRKKVNPKARAFLLRVDSYNTKPFDDKLAKELNIYQLFGWNDNALKFIEFIIGRIQK